MIYNVYAIYDRKAAVYSQPFYCPNDQVAMRMLSAMVNDRSTQISAFPEDFSLHQLGTFNDASGVFVTPKEPVPLINANSLVKTIQFQPQTHEGS